MKKPDILLIIVFILLLLGISEKSNADVVYGIQARDNASLNSIKAKLYKIPWWVDTLSSIKIKGGFKIGDLFKEPDSTVPVSVRSSVKLSGHSRLKVNLGGDRSSLEVVRYTSEITEWYLRQENEDSTVGYRFRF